MDNYISEALNEIYGKEDNFIIIGLTGQTGSGCTTAAKILASNKDKISHSLYQGNTPTKNEQRKEKIIYNYFRENWDEFHIISASAVITLLWALDFKNDNGKEFLRKFIIKHKSLCKKYNFSAKSDRPKIQLLIQKLEQQLEKISEEPKKDNKTDDNAENMINFYTKKIQEVNDEIKNILKNDIYIELYQAFGRNIRLSCNVYLEEQNKGSFFTVSKKINEIIERIRSKTENKKTFIVIDALRNPLEAFFFQKRYSAFYLIAILCEDVQRKNRLINLNLTEKEIQSISKNEYTDRPLNEIDGFISQNIPACLQKADIYINNNDASDEVGKFKNLANQLIRIITLIKKPGLVTPTLQERCMQIAYTAKLNSGCISRQVGAVVTDKNYSLKSIGWNDTPHGQVPCNLRNRNDLLNGYDTEAYSFYEKNNSEFITRFKENTKVYQNITADVNFNYCFKDELNSIKKQKNQVYTRALHAEENAFLQISKYGGMGIHGGILFTTASPCELCAKKAYQLGISKIYYIDPYPGISKEHILQAGNMPLEMILFSGAIGRAFYQLYSPVIPYKDELSNYKCS
jgi:deoxycytidylate deaminase